MTIQEKYEFIGQYRATFDAALSGDPIKPPRGKVPLAAYRLASKHVKEVRKCLGEELKFSPLG